MHPNPKLLNKRGLGPFCTTMSPLSQTKINTATKAGLIIKILKVVLSTILYSGEMQKMEKKKRKKKEKKTAILHET